MYGITLNNTNKYSSFSVLHFIILISGSKSVKFVQKLCIFLKFLTLEGTLAAGKIVEENSFFNATKIFPEKPAKPTLARANRSILDPVTTTCFCNRQPTLA